MKQKVSQRKAFFKWRRKLAFVLLLVFCFGSLVMMQSRYGRVMMLASLHLHPQSARGPKVAFLFIARNRLPLDIVWDAFFQVIFSMWCSVVNTSSYGCLFAIFVND